MDIESLLQRMRALLVECGVPPDAVEQLSGASMGIREFVALAEPDLLLEDRSTLPLAGWDVTAVHTPGHSPGHVCFYAAERRLLLSGDHVLPRISPNIAVHAQQPGNPLADFLDALTRVRELDVDEVLPAHEWRFRGLRARVDELVEHHRARLDETEAVLRDTPGLTCWHAAPKLQWSRDWAEITGFMQRAAIGETLAHLVLLESRGRARREGHTPERWYPCPPARSHKDPERSSRSGALPPARSHKDPERSSRSGALPPE
jgi:glyoxylase-like metal-dependent hydrolase (beta-lactamase superfamily II)